MTSAFSYWAQALDNSSPDHIVINGKEIYQDDELQRQEIVRCVYAVIKRGTKVFEVHGLNLTVDKLDFFVIEIPSMQLDIAGRVAPIVCLGNITSFNAEGFGIEVFERLSDCATMLGRTLSADYKDLTVAAFKAAKVSKKKLRARKNLQISLGFIVLVSTVAALKYFLSSSTI